MLPLGTRLRDFEITGLVGEGGFGIVYLAWDHSLQRRVASRSTCRRRWRRASAARRRSVKSERHVDTFKAGLKSFVNEARLLARFDHPSLVKVYRFWEENGTAYMVMPYYEGPTLKARSRPRPRPSEAEIRAWLKPILNALALMHAAQCYHRDIAPDNILLTPRGPLLLDFGAARRVIGDMTHAMTVVLKPGYAPIEQYGDVGSMAQGPWTDLYALACVVYFAITGKTPTSSVERLMDDRLEPLSTSAAGRYSPAFLHAIDAALSVRPADRPQDHRQFRALLDADLPPPFGDTSAGCRSTTRRRRSGRRCSATSRTALPHDRAPGRHDRGRGAGARSDRCAGRRRPHRLQRLARPRRAIRACGPAAAPRRRRPLRRRDRGRIGRVLVGRQRRPQAEAACDRADRRERFRRRGRGAFGRVPADADHRRACRDAGVALASARRRPRRPRRPRPTRRARHVRTATSPTPHVDASVDTKPTPTPAPTHPSVSAKCSDILQKASLESLSAEESAYLKKECR